MNNLLSYCGLVEARISASEKDLPVHYEHKKKEKYGGRNSRSWIKKRAGDNDL